MKKNDALKLEYRIKQLSARKKIFELTKGEGIMVKNIEKDLLAINEEVKAVAIRIEELTKAIGNLEKANPAKPKVLKKKAPAKKKAVAVKPTSKKPDKKTDREVVLGFIQRAKKGIDTATLMKKTGFNQKKIANIVFQFKKHGKILTAEKGIYSKA
jgi:hypothetical protein